MTPFTAKLVSNKPCFYRDIFFATRMRVSQESEKSVTSLYSQKFGGLHCTSTRQVTLVGAD